MTTATDNLNAKIDGLTSAVVDVLTQIEDEVSTIKANANSATVDDSDVVNASADRISALTATLRNGLTSARAEITIAAGATGGTGAAVAPGTASTAAPVALAGVPETPVPAAGLASAGPAVPSTDGVVTANSPNQDTSNTASATAPNGTSVSAQPAAVAEPSGDPVATGATGA